VKIQGIKKKKFNENISIRKKGSRNLIEFVAAKVGSRFSSKEKVRL